MTIHVTEPVRRPRPVEAAARSRWRLAPGLVAGLLVLLLVGALALALRGSGSQPTPVPGPSIEPTLSTRYVARGQVRPVSHARVGTLAGGVVQELRVEVGDVVSEQQQLARVVSTGTELITAPFAGTVTSVLVRRGDTVTPGATLLTVGDVSRLQVETTDLDEFVIARVYRGQRIAVLVEALGTELPGIVRTAAIEPTRSLDGDEHYPVTIDLLDHPPELRPGMNVRVRFEDAS